MWFTDSRKWYVPDKGTDLDSELKDIEGMPRVLYIETNGTSIEADVPIGQNLMMAACANAVQGILGDCGGGLSCATCHVLVDERYAPLLPAPDDTERQMLEFTAVPRQSNSRLSCQKLMREELDGIVLHLPHTQV